MKALIETERLLLREINMNDAPEMFLLHSNLDVQKYTGEAAVQSIEEIKQAIQIRIKDYKKYGYGRWACFLKKEMQFLGWAGLAFLPEFNEIDLGYRFLPQYWGMGIATEAAHAVLGFGFNTLQIKRIVAIAMKENKASIKVMRKLGMEFEKFAPYEPGSKDVAWYFCDKKLFKKNSKF